MTNANFKKVAASRIVSLKFSVISKDSYTLVLPVDKLFSCVLRTMQLITFVYIATLKIILRIILSHLFVSQEVVLLAFVS